LAIRIHDRKRKGLSPLIIKGKPCGEFKEAIRLLLDTDPSYYYKLRKKHLGGGWQKALPAEATAPEKAEVAETSVSEIKIDEPDAKDAEVCDPDPVPMPSDGTVDKVHSTANESESPIVKKKADNWLRTDLRTHLLASFPDIVSGEEDHDEKEFYLCEVGDHLKSLVDFIRTLPPVFVTTLHEAAEHVEHENTNTWLADRRHNAIVAILEEAGDTGITGKEIRRKMPFSDSKLFPELKNGLVVGLWTFRNGRYHAAEKLEPDLELAHVIIAVMERDSATAYSAEVLADHISGATVKDVQRVLERGINEGGSWVCVDETEGTYMLEDAYEAWQESQANDEANEYVNKEAAAA